MAFRRFSSGILVRVLAILLISVLFAFSILRKDWFFTPLVSGVLLALAVSELIYHLNSYQRGLNSFLIAIKQSGFNTHFPTSSRRDKDLFQTFNDIIQLFQELSIEKEISYQFLKALTENIETGIIVIDQEEKIKWINPEAKALVNKPGISNLNDLALSNRQILSQIRKLSPGKKQLIQLKRASDTIEASLQTSQIISGDEQLTVIILQNIHRELEIKEVEAWQKLVRVMRHEIMNSMTPIVNLTEAVNTVLSEKDQFKSGESEFEDVKESLRAVEDRSKAMIRFVNAYRDFAQIPDLKINNFQLVKMMIRVKAYFEKDLISRKVQLDLDIKPDALEIEADEELLEQVVINIIKNSLEAVDSKKGSIQIYCRKDGNNILMKISDNGPGIGPEEMERIFVPFYTTKSQGSGIGLSLSRQIIHKHGGRINAISNEGMGATFLIEL